MMSNLFSIFDPTTEINGLPLNWTSTFIGLLLIPTSFWLIPSRNSMMVSLLMNKLHQEMKTILSKGNENKGNSFILASLFLMILMNNFLGLFPYIFTSTSHLTLTLTVVFLWFNFLYYSLFVLWGLMLMFFESWFFLSYLVYQGSLNYIIYFYFPILKELMIYVSYCFISINNSLLVVKC